MRRRLQGRIRRTEEAVAAAEEAVASLHRQLEDEAVAADYTRVLELTASWKNRTGGWRSRWRCGRSSN